MPTFLGLIGCQFCKVPSFGVPSLRGAEVSGIHYSNWLVLGYRLYVNVVFALWRWNAVPFFYVFGFEHLNMFSCWRWMVKWIFAKGDLIVSLIYFYSNFHHIFPYLVTILTITALHSFFLIIIVIIIKCFRPPLKKHLWGILFSPSFVGVEVNESHWYKGFGRTQCKQYRKSKTWGQSLILCPLPFNLFMY